MHRGLFEKLKTGVIVAVACIASAGCAMIDHSNTLLFGTNTAVGLQVGVDSSNVPSINVGYRRQEVAFLPLLANLKDAQGNFVPCPGTVAVKASDNTPDTASAALVNSCKFLAKNGAGQAEDSYSVLASFGANFTANADKGSVGAGGGLAQYFATGTAAQLLALRVCPETSCGIAKFSQHEAD